VDSIALNFMPNQLYKLIMTILDPRPFCDQTERERDAIYFSIFRLCKKDHSKENITCVISNFLGKVILVFQRKNSKPLENAKE
jgi:hypothetical protein